MKQKRFKLVYILLGLIFSGIAVPLKFLDRELIGLLLHDSNTFITQVIQNNRPIKIDTTIKRDIFVSGFPDFDNLKVENLDRPVDIREVYNYKDNLIVAGYNNIYEINSGSNKIVRRLNQNILSCVNHTAKIENYLYILCYGPNDNGVYKIDLNSGSIVTKYIGVGIGNGNMASFGNTIWIAGINGAVSINTKYDLIKSFYFKDNLIFKNVYNKDEEYSVYANEKFIWLNNYNSSKGVTKVIIVNPETGKWTIYPLDELSKSLQIENLSIYPFAFSNNKAYFSNDSFRYSTEEGHYINLLIEYSLNEGWKKVTDLSTDNMNDLLKTDTRPLDYKYKVRDKYIPDAIILDYGDLKSDYYDINSRSPKLFSWPTSKELPLYMSISNRVNNTYYLLSTRGIEILNKGDVEPKVYYDNLPHPFWADGSMYVTLDSKYFIFTGFDDSEGPDGVMYPKIYVLNIAANKIIDLSPSKVGYKRYPKEDRIKYQEIKDGDITFGQEVNIISIFSKEKEKIAEIDLSKPSFTLIRTP